MVTPRSQSRKSSNDSVSNSSQPRREESVPRVVAPRAVAARGALAWDRFATSTLPHLPEVVLVPGRFDTAPLPLTDPKISSPVTSAHPTYAGFDEH